MTKRFLIQSLFFALLLMIGQNVSGQVRPQRVQSNPNPTPAEADTSKAKRVQIINSDLLSYIQENGVGLQKLLGDVQLKQDSTFFYSDSAYYFESKNQLEAYDKVKVEMPDGLSLFSDKLSYDTDTKISEVYDNITLTNGEVILNSDRMTYYRNENYGLYKEGGKMIDGDNVLTSQLGHYYPKEDMAYFRDSVTLVTPDYVLETDTLGYDIEAKVSYFLTETLITSDDGIIETTNGFYDTDKGVVNLYSRSTVKDSSYTLVADTLIYLDKQDLGMARGNVLIEQEDSSLQIRGGYGEFNRKTDESLVTKNAMAIQLFDDDTLYMVADTLFSIKVKTTTPLPQPRAKKKTEDKTTPENLPNVGLGKLDSVKSDIDSTSLNLNDSTITDSTITDSTITDSTITDSTITDSTITDSALINDSIPIDSTQLDSTQSDSIQLKPNITVTASNDSTKIPLINSDTLLDEVEDPNLIGPLPLPPLDTLEYRLFKAYDNVSFFMNGMQGRADSMVYFYDDSIMYLFGSPVLWSEQNQISGDTIIIWMKNEQVDSMWIGRNGFMASEEDTVGFNQIKGKEMRAKFVDNDLYRLHVIGNSESIYFAKNEEDSTNIFYEGMNKALSQEMFIYFVDNEVKRIVFLTKPEGSFSPFFEVIFQDNKLEGMRWRIEERPEKPDVFEKPVVQVADNPDEIPEDIPLENAIEPDLEEEGKKALEKIIQEDKLEKKKKEGGK